jgi:hypothetical protein
MPTHAVAAIADEDAEARDRSDRQVVDPAPAPGPIQAGHAIPRRELTPPDGHIAGERKQARKRSHIDQVAETSQVNSRSRLRNPAPIRQ